MSRILFLAVAAVATLATTTTAEAAKTRACGPDPIANVATILCAPPSGPCDATSVVVSTSLMLVDGPCAFDLEGRALRIERTLQLRISADGAANVFYVEITNAGDVTIGKRGRIKVRGDFVRPDGITFSGGSILIFDSGTVRVAGLLDVSGDPGGSIEIDGPGSVIFERSARIRASGTDGAIDMGMQETDGGELVVLSGGSVTFNGRAQLRGGSAGIGGTFDFVARRDIEVSGRIDASGGGFGGGEVSLFAGDDVRLTRANFDVRSRGAGDDGGYIDIVAGRTFTSGNQFPGVVTGGSLTMDRVIMNASASANDLGAAGQGGILSFLAYGAIRATRLAIHADGTMSTNNPDGYGGVVEFESALIEDFFAPTEQPADLDVEIDGLISLRGGGNDAFGGLIDFTSAGNLVLAATIDAGARGFGGLVTARASGDLAVRAPIDTAVDGTNGEGGEIRLAAGVDRVGTLTIASDLRGGGGRRNPTGPVIDLRGCPVTVADGVSIDAGGGVGTGQPLPPTLRFVSGRPLQLGKGSRYDAGPNGTISAYHPPLQAPMIASGVRFDPPLLDVFLPPSAFPTCPRCGDGPGDACNPEVRIDAITSDAEHIAATVTATSPPGLPLTGDVAVCDGSGVEDVTFTWLVRSCGPSDTFELTVNDTVVADVTQEAVACDCPGALRSHTIPLEDVAPLLTAGQNRFGVRKSQWLPANGGCTAIKWAYATVTADGIATRVPIFFDPPLTFANPGSDPFATTDACDASCTTLDTSGSVALCHSVAATPWSGALPCGLDLAPLAPDHDYTLFVRATDGIVAPPISAEASFTHTAQTALTVNGASCP